MKRPGRAGTQVALVQLPAVDANESGKVGKLKVRWVYKIQRRFTSSVLNRFGSFEANADARVIRC